MTFGEKVRAARLAAGYSQRDVSEMTGLSLRTIQNYESGERLPKQRESYTLMSRALNVPIQTLLDENADFTLETQDEHVSRKDLLAQRIHIVVLDARTLVTAGHASRAGRYVQTAYVHTLDVVSRLTSTTAELIHKSCRRTVQVGACLQDQYPHR